MSYVFMPEIVGMQCRNLSYWIDEHKLLKHTGYQHREFDVEKALELESEFRPEMVLPTLCFTIDEVLPNLNNGFRVDVPLPTKEHLLFVLNSHFEEAKQTEGFYEYVDEKPYSDTLHLRLIGQRYKSGSFEGWVEVTLQICEKYMQKWKGELKKRSRVLTLGFHVERADPKLLAKLTKKEVIT